MDATKDTSPDTSRDERPARPGPPGPGFRSPLSAEWHNDSTHDSTVDTDGKNWEAVRLANGGPISPDGITTSNATLDNSVPEASDGLAGFDSRVGGNGLLLAVRPEYEVVNRGVEFSPLPYRRDNTPAQDSEAFRVRATFRFEIRRSFSQD